MEATRKILPPEWRAFLEDTLVHRIRLVRAGATPTLEGNPTDGEVVENVPCYITVSRARLITATSREQQANWAVNLPPDCGVKIDDRLEHGVTAQGVLILEGGRVNRFEPEIDADAGIVLYTAYIVDGI